MSKEEGGESSKLPGGGTATTAKTMSENQQQYSEQELPSTSTAKSVLDQSEEVMKFYHMQMEHQQQAARNQLQQLSHQKPKTPTQAMTTQLHDQVQQAELLSQLQSQIIQQQQQIGQLRALNNVHTTNGTAAAGTVATGAVVATNMNNNNNKQQQQYAQSQYASLGSLRAQDLCRMQLNSPTINAASALLSAASPPALVMPPIVPPPTNGNGNATNGKVTKVTLKPKQIQASLSACEKKRVPHIYHDYGQVPDNNFVRKKTGGVTQPFPEKLMDMLDKEGCSCSGRNAHIVSWLPHGRAFIVRKPQEFTTVIMSTYFRQTKITSFQRQLNLYGFRRITQGPDAGAYYHEMFLRGRPNLCTRMVRTKVKGTGHKQPSDARSEPNFYSMPHQPEVHTATMMTTEANILHQLSHEANGGTIPFSPHLHGAANLLTGFAQGAMNTSNIPPLSLDQRNFYSAAGALTGLNNGVLKSNNSNQHQATTINPATSVGPVQPADNGGGGGYAAESADFVYPRQQHGDAQQQQQQQQQQQKQQERLKVCESSRPSSMGAVHKSESFEKLCITSV